MMGRYWNDGFNGMMDFGTRASGWFIVYDIIKLLIIAAVVIFIVNMFMKNYSNTNKSNSNSSTNRAIEILGERYASGELSDEEYQNKLKNLQ